MNAAKKHVVGVFGPVGGFGRTRGPCSLYLSAAAGEIPGFLGPSGSGKSTTRRILLGFISPAAGAARVFALDRWADSVGTRRHLAVLRVTGARRRTGSRHGTVR